MKIFSFSRISELKKGEVKEKISLECSHKSFGYLSNKSLIKIKKKMDLVEIRS